MNFAQETAEIRSVILTHPIGGHYFATIIVVYFVRIIVKVAQSNILLCNNRITIRCVWLMELIFYL